MAKTPKSHNKAFLIALITALLLATLVGAVLMFIPFQEQVKTEAVINQELGTYKTWRSAQAEVVNNGNATALPEEVTILPELLEQMQLYNSKILLEGQKNLDDAFAYENPAFDLSEYGLENDVFGVVSIPSINVEMPLYLGANWENLTKGFAQLSETSMPIGGESTNCVLACHRGWCGVPFLRNVELVKVGDPVYLQNPWETLKYRVSEIRVILPDETENILIQEDRDLLTIVTCHPYAVNTHRYLLICERYQEPVADLPEVTGDWTWVRVHGQVTTSDGQEFTSSQGTIFVTYTLPWIILGVCFFCILILIAVCIAMWLRRRKRSRSN